MSEVLDRVENRGRQEGRREGRQEGRQVGQLEGAMKKAKETVLNLHHMGMDAEFISKAVNVSLDQVQQWLSQVLA